MITGYKFTADERRNIFYVTLSCFNEKQHWDGWYTTDCIVEKIENANTGETVDEIQGFAYANFTYRVGEHITGRKIFYCHSIQELFDMYHIEKRNGIVRRGTLITNFKYMQRYYEAHAQKQRELAEQYNEIMERRRKNEEHRQERRNRAIEREKLRQERINRAIEREERCQKMMNLAVERKEINQRMRNRMTEYAKKRGWIEADVE